MDSAGDFVIAWEDAHIIGSYNIFAQAYNASGVPQGSNFQVSPASQIARNANPSVAMDAAGDFVVAWQGQGNIVKSPAIFAQLYTFNGTSQPVASGSEFAVNTDTRFDTSPAVAMDSTGDFVVVWESVRAGSPISNIDAQRFNASGVCREASSGAG